MAALAAPLCLDAQDTTALRAPAAGTGYIRRDSRYDVTRPLPDSPLFLANPSNVTTIYELTPDGRGFYVYQRVGGRDVRPPSYITRQEYEDMLRREQQRDYWRQKANTRERASGGGIFPGLNINSGLFKDIFGSGKIDIRPNVTALIDLSVRTNTLQNPALTLRQQRNTFFDFRQQIQMNVVGTVGERLRIRANYDTEASFNFENQFKVDYLGMEDDVLKKIEVGNVSMPINGSLITGGQNLFGVKAQFQVGPAMITTLASQQRGRTNEIIIRGSEQSMQFQKKASEYDDNRHFFLSHYFRSLYEQALSNPPVLLSRINITRVEVWITNRNAATTTNTRNGLGFVDLGEGAAGGVRFNPNIFPTGAPAANGSNNLFAAVSAAPGVRNYATAVTTLQNLPGLGLRNDADFELVQNMRRLNENEYVLQPQLGYISLNQKLQPNDVLLVAFEYTITGQQGTFRVGEFGNDVTADENNSNLLLLKLLKPSSIRPTLQNRPYPAWDLMMKNIYNLGAYNISANNFRFDVVYEGQTGQGDVNYLPAPTAPNRPLIQLLDLDRLTNNNELGPDNRFDFLPKLTIDPERGLIIFPVLEPFGRHVAEEVLNNSADTARYAFPELYRSTQVDAFTLYPQKDRYKFRGTYTGTTGNGGTGLDIDLNSAQVVPGSVKITSGGGQLAEGVDYVVDYQIGRVTLLNSALRSTNAEMRITWESNVLFGIDQKLLLGTRIDYRVNRNLMLGGTLLYLNETPLINKVVIGEEPMQNLLWGLDGTYTTQSRAITRLLDKLPFYQTEAPSTVALQAEFAQLRPGVSNRISTDQERGIAYIDDFEGTVSSLDLGSNIESWQISSVPSTIPVPPLTGVARLDSLRRGFDRSLLSWYRIDARFYDNPSQFGLGNSDRALTGNESRRVSQNEVYPNRTIAQSDYLATFDIQYNPLQRGPYNYEFRTSELNPDGTFRNPADQWGGIMRRTTGNTDFEAANFEYLEFWLLDPFDGQPAPVGNGDLYINLGRVSEDILPDNRLSFENGLPTSAGASAAGVGVDSTAWGRVPQRQSTTNAFDNDPAAREFQDVGLDGVGAAQEQAFFADVLNAATPALDADAAAALRADPSTDNFRFFTDYPGGTSIVGRYRGFYGLEGNSPVASQGGDFAAGNKLGPDIEDINQDNTPSLTESFYEYRLGIRPTDLQINQNYIVERRDVPVRLANGGAARAVWYLFRIPLRSGLARGGIQNFKSIDFIRMYMTGFAQPIVMRLASFRLVSTQWRSLNRAIRFDSLAVTPNSELRLGTVGVEENSQKLPFNYVSPPQIQRQGQPSNPIPNQLQNEQALQLQIRNLPDGEARGAFKNISYDLRFYKRIQLWVHAEATDGVVGTGTGNFDNRGDATAFMRIGGDYTDNFYEVEVDLTPSNPAAGINNIDNIWLAENEIDVALDDLTATKVARNNAGFDFRQRYTRTLPNGLRITVVGNPQLNNTKTAFLGIRNPVDATGRPISVEAWFNELRVTDFDTYSGWAATARLNLRLADLGDLQLSGSRVTPGFGDVQDRIWERSLDDRKQWDVATNLQLGKLLPQKAGIELPIFFSYGERVIEPLYNPLDPDVKLDTRLNFTAPELREQVYQESIEYQRNISYAINNLRRIRTGEGKPRFWDIENWSVSYAFSELFMRNAQVQSRIQQQYFGSLVYQFSFNPKIYQPFKGKGQKRNLLTEFNFSLLPSQVGFRIDGNRYWEEEKLRNLPGTDFEVAPTYVQNFTVTRAYTLRWDLTRSLGFTFTATDISRVDEPRGRIDNRQKRDSLLRNLVNVANDDYWNWLNFGRSINYQQNIAAQYRLPFQYFKPLDWWSANAAYTADYRWLSAARQNERLGNTISNQRTIQGDVQFNFTSLYKKFPFIGRLLKPIPRRTIYSEADSSRRRGDNRTIALRNTAKAFGGLAFSIQSIDINYQRTDGSQIPGFLPGVDFLGLDMDWINPLTGQSYLAPGFGFLLGDQPDLTDRSGFWATALERGWISSDPRLAAQWAQIGSEQITGRVAMQLFRGLRVDFNLSRQTTENASGLFSFVPDSSDWLLSNEAGAGTYSITFFAANTAFTNSDELFREFELRARPIISNRLRERNASYNTVLGTNAGRVPGGLWNGYTGSSQEVLVPAFLSTYGPYSSQSVGLTAFPRLPLPNWRVSFQGLSDVWFMKDLFRTVTLTHGYTSTYTTSWLRNLRALDLNGDGIVDVTEPTPNDSARQNFLVREVIQSVLISEQFSPLIGVNLVFHNGISVTTDYKRGRTLLLNVGALQLTESANEEITFALQYRKDGKVLPLSLFGRSFDLKNNFTIRCEATIRRSTTRNRRLESELAPEPTGGNRGYTVKPSFDYNVGPQLTARAYYELTVNTPVLSNSFPTRYTAWGVQLRLTLQ